jgi:hypothetical protein
MRHEERGDHIGRYKLRERIGEGGVWSHVANKKSRSGARWL